MTNSGIWAIIPARGGSKGIPRKNVRPFLGIPLLAHSIRHALQVRGVDRVIVSTDDPEIADVAKRHGAEVVWRPAEISGDIASSESAILHVLDHEAELGRQPELVLFLQATSPIRDSRDIEGALAQFEQEQADSLFSATRLNWFVWRAGDNGVEPLNYDHRRRPMRQQAPEDLIETGSFYIFKPSVLRSHGSRLGGKVTAYRCKFYFAHQIDEPEDLELLERLAPAVGTSEPLDLSSVALLVLDFDGVLTDNAVWVNQEGMEMVRCSRGDSLGLAMLRSSEVEVIVLSTETNDVVRQRCEKLNVSCVSGQANKLASLRRILENRGLDAKNVAYVGNDLNDLECMRHVGFPIAVGDAHPDIRAMASWTTSCAGGRGAVREVCELMLQSRSASLVREDQAAVSVFQGGRDE